MKYSYQEEPIPQDKRKSLNEKVLYLIDNDSSDSCSISPADIYNAYTGDGGLHGLERDDYENYHAYSEAKKEIENGQFFTPPRICNFVTACLKLSEYDLVADLTCGMGSFFNFIPAETNIYGCDLDVRAVKVAKFLYPAATIECRDIRTCQPDTRFDYVIGNPPFHLKWWTQNGRELSSQMYYCLKAAEVLKPLGILALIVPKSYLSDTFTDSGQIREMEKHYSFLGQVLLPEDAFSYLGVSRFPTKLQFWQKKTAANGWKSHPYRTEAEHTLARDFNVQEESQYIHKKIVAFAKSALENNQSKILLELAKSSSTSGDFKYQTQKLLYHIKVHPVTRPSYARCCEYLHRFYTQRMPEGMRYEL
ncbi:N-6 DNA methylase [Enterocloster clostridioformis]|uniref:site-specific DNA-methyltransferase (adenine-specific) n=1 Tax=Enterocloster clostridioformis TaxID=1531 RepID=A0A2X2U1E1_9FIRM|nr:N-6 DNA methylase [Enterocloster clostridioformis]MCA5577276.1 SAM-dependent methyltransferase [Enterocloster clostridioformis]SQB10154.1 helicase [Enterocloster clostridioformis]